MKTLLARNTTHRTAVLPGAEFLGMREVLNEAGFLQTIAIERKRTERTREPFLLMVLETGEHLTSEKKPVRILERAAATLLTCTRETDVIGWYRERRALGVVYTGIAPQDTSAAMAAILNRINGVLHTSLQLEQMNQLSISVHVFPDDWNDEDFGSPANPALYPDLLKVRKSRRAGLTVKRAVDVAVSAALLTACSPLLLVIAAAVKLSSEGPILFKQQRVGEFGRCFTFLKFRSMRTNNDSKIHQEYVARLISNQLGDDAQAEGGKRVYKMTNDSRVTTVGKFLRRTSLDELPQLLNVFMGEMSLVGPRPPIPYELAKYQTWHRQRLLRAKPGITGLWQVNGRSRVCFDDMVRMDLEYAAKWSPWLDMKILLKTPLAVIQGAGAC